MSTCSGLSIPVSSAIVVAPAAPGAGGQGAAAAAMQLGLRANGVDCAYIGLPEASAVSRLVAERPLRRWPGLAREFDRRALRRQSPRGWDLAYAMPGFLPRAGQGVKVLHQATHHPRRVLEALRAARLRAGGGRGFITARETAFLEAELRDADVIRAESSAVARELREAGIDPAKCVVCYPGVDLERFAPAARSEELTVAFVGVLSLWKGVDILVRLAANLRGAARFAVVGGPVCPWSRRLVAAAAFEFHSDVPTVLGMAHALVLPSASDGFGYVVLEAMAAGAVPFVSPEVGAAELVKRIDQRLVQPREAFAESVPELLGSLPLGELGARARRVAEEFGRREMAELAAARVLEAVGRR